MKLRRTLLVASCALLLAPAAARAARRDAVTVEADLAGASSPSASGVARLTREAGRTIFTLKVRGLPPGAYRILVGGALEGFLFVESAGPAEVRFDSRAFDDETPVTRAGESEAMGLAFDPRGRSIQVAREGQVLLEAVFPSRPAAGLR